MKECVEITQTKPQLKDQLIGILNNINTLPNFDKVAEIIMKKPKKSFMIKNQVELKKQKQEAEDIIDQFNLMSKAAKNNYKALINKISPGSKSTEKFTNHTRHLTALYP